ncbi:MAG: NADH-quinone oxidoreductase subunit NuoH [Dehalococcoidia bacterium]|nr:NADH-quinone oxidoreductase subunit NuoH [Dehalococcoidia bacterium]
MNADLFGLELNVWADAAIRLVMVVTLMTVVVMGYTYLERKIIARFNRRLGPTKTGPWGLLQAVADALKLVGKEDLRPRSADPWTFELGPYMIFIPIFMGFVIVPFIADFHIRLLDLGLIYFVAISSVSIVGWVMAGWGSDNRYAMLGALRSVAQGISYELPLVLSLLAVGMYAGSFNLGVIIAGQDVVPNIVWQPMAAFIFFIAALAELNRTPFDIPLGESEVVGGPFVEYSGIRWSMFQLGEYASIFIMSLVFSAVFLGGWMWPFGEDLGRWFQVLLSGIKAGGFFFVVVWIRISVPRMRIDQLMGYSWKVLLPLALVQVLVNGLVMVNGWHEVTLLISGLVGVAVLVTVTGRVVAAPSVRPGPARPLMPTPAIAQGEAVS